MDGPSVPDTVSHRWADISYDSEYTRTNDNDTQPRNEPAPADELAQHGKPSLIVDITPEIMAVEEQCCRNRGNAEGDCIETMKSHWNLIAVASLSDDDRMNAEGEDDQGNRHAQSPLVERPLSRLILPVIVVSGRIVRVSPPHRLD